MGTPGKRRKISGVRLPDGSIPAINQLKDLWQSKFSESDKDYWRHRLFSPDATNPEMKAEIRERYGIALSYDHQVTRWRQWVTRLESYDNSRETREEMIRRELSLIEYQVSLEQPTWTTAQVLSETLIRAQRRVLLAGYAESLATGDVGKGLMTSKEHRGVQHEETEASRLKLQMEKAAAYDRAQKLLEDGQKAPGGITKETLERIERELKLHPS